MASHKTISDAVQCALANMEMMRQAAALRCTGYPIKYPHRHHSHERHETIKECILAIHSELAAVQIDEAKERT